MGPTSRSSCSDDSDFDIPLSSKSSLSKPVKKKKDVSVKSRPSNSSNMKKSATFGASITKTVKAYTSPANGSPCNTSKIHTANIDDVSLKRKMEEGSFPATNNVKRRKPGPACKTLKALSVQETCFQNASHPNDKMTSDAQVIKVPEGRTISGLHCQSRPTRTYTDRFSVLDEEQRKALLDRLEPKRKVLVLIHNLKEQISEEEITRHLKSYKSSRKSENFVWEDCTKQSCPRLGRKHYQMKKTINKLQHLDAIAIAEQISYEKYFANTKKKANSIVEEVAEYAPDKVPKYLGKDTKTGPVVIQSRKALKDNLPPHREVLVSIHKLTEEIGRDVLKEMLDDAECAVDIEKFVWRKCRKRASGGLPACARYGDNHYHWALSDGNGFRHLDSVAIMKQGLVESGHRKSYYVPEPAEKQKKRNTNYKSRPEVKKKMLEKKIADRRFVVYMYLCLRSSDLQNANPEEVLEMLKKDNKLDRWMYVGSYQQDDWMNEITARHHDPKKDATSFVKFLFGEDNCSSKKGQIRVFQLYAQEVHDFVSYTYRQLEAFYTNFLLTKQNVFPHHKVLNRKVDDTSEYNLHAKAVLAAVIDKVDLFDYNKTEDFSDPKSLTALPLVFNPRRFKEVTDTYFKD